VAATWKSAEELLLQADVEAPIQTLTWAMPSAGRTSARAASTWSRSSSASAQATH
jgi:hypothetical protein